jgi:hypothetical protein
MTKRNDNRRRKRRRRITEMKENELEQSILYKKEHISLPITFLTTILSQYIYQKKVKQYYSLPEEAKDLR